ncbi:MAG: MFS transporter [Promethearchaeota archaeon]
MKRELPYVFIIYHLIGIPIGTIFALKLIYKELNHFASYLISNASIVFFFICLIIIEQPWFVPIGLFGAGFSIGIVLGLLYRQFYPVFKEARFGARYFSTAFMFVAFLIIIEALIDINSNSLLGIIFFILVYLLIFIFSMLGKETISKLPIQESLNISAYLKEKKGISKVVFAFFAGFLWVNIYYVTILFLEKNDLDAKLNIFVIIFCISIILSSFPGGLIADMIGRRVTVLIGLIFQALAFLILSFYSQNEFVLLYISPLLLGAGLSLSLTTSYLIYGELSEYQYLRDNGSLFLAFMMCGSVTGVIIAEIMRPLFLVEPTYLTVVLFFVFILAAIVIIQMRETLPTRAVLKWERPTEKISEEDVQLYKEQKICLICKGHVGGFTFTFICPKCDVLYCEKCARALANLENKCWVCGHPIDESKHVKHQKKREEDLEIKKKTDKKLKS